MARVTCRCQPVQDRTSYWSSPTSPFAASKRASIVQRVPATRTSVARPVPSGARGQVEGQLVRLVELAPDQEALLPTGQGAAPVGRVGPIVRPRPLRPLAGAQPLPALGRYLGGPRARSPAAGRWSPPARSRAGGP